MKNTIKYYLIQFEMLMMVICFMVGVGAAEVGSWGWAYALIFGPFIFGYLFNFNEQIHFCQVYSRAWSISLKSNK